MKKIFLMLFAVCAFAACDPIHEKIGNGGHISVDELISKTTVTVDKAASGQNGNVITCETLAPVNAKWDIGGKEFVGNYATKKMKLGSYSVKLTAICADGTELTADFPVTCSEITDPLQKFYIFGSPDNTEPAILGPGDAAAGRFSDGEGKYFPFLSDEVYFGKKTLIFDIIEAEEGKFIWGDDFGCTVRVMSGWWDGPFADNVPLSVGLWELPITDEIANTCAKGATAHDLDLMMTRGTVKIKSVYYEE
jgi:hypothetical protein